MWPGEQQPNPYQQPPPPHQHQANPYQRPSAPHQQQVPWSTSTAGTGGPTPQPGGGGGGGSRRTTLVAVVAATAVVVATGVAGFLLLGGGDGGSQATPTESASPRASETNPRSGDGTEPTIAGWKTVVNPDIGVAFDVPAEWALKEPGWVSYVAEDDDTEENVLIGMRAPAFLKEEWCSADDDQNGHLDHWWLAAAGSRGDRNARSTEEIARADSRTWVYGAYTQPDKSLVESAKVESYTTNSGIAGSLGTARSAGVEKTGKCRTDGKSTTFAFKNAEGDFVAWSFVGPTGVSEEVPDATVRKILGTVRLYEDPTSS
ncbi:hypothetical protein [Streptomyces sp. DSM 40750]|uniref:hypothetical protein n=1 Tax=Streptomyces sp. DSM 40750 TaxID=2801030 RepID=UPI00214ABDB6|nr:hypothetical protein [Streptomyces sp. DSM 40750]UUU20525.1 hypothetical protein JIX55_09505 [Streptomyces sp. DSM 40750]